MLKRKSLDVLGLAETFLQQEGEVDVPVMFGMRTHLTGMVGNCWIWLECVIYVLEISYHSIMGAGRGR